MDEYVRETALIDRTQYRELIIFSWDVKEWFVNNITFEATLKNRKWIFYNFIYKKITWPIKIFDFTRNLSSRSQICSSFFKLSSDLQSYVKLHRYPTEVSGGNKDRKKRFGQLKYNKTNTQHNFTTSRALLLRIIIQCTTYQQL